jgi:septal ring factor EnvC (AmiA/AmiB activator)
MKQAEKDAVLAAARSAYEQEFNQLSALVVDDVVAPPPDLQIQLDAAKTANTDLQNQLTAKQNELDQVKINAASLQSKIDMVRAAIN